ncbi:anthranilate synthase component I [uncultured Methanobrevibacter sp.]|uniref:anthranilate synthase component I n=1 Tax=uncultured Methanobrevibacter sp. TaxID=253161 RepID=UPI0025D0017F|nr:anthranilate synthase component I [uncultured Methanobrevibacter sp.]
MFSPSLKDIKEIAKDKQYKRIPVAYELFSDIATPIEVLRILKGISNHCYMLESIEDAENWGRYSFLGFDPLLEFTCQNNVVQIKGDCEFNKFNEEIITIKTDNPSEIIRDLIRKNKSPKLESLPPFTGGFVGYFAYDYIKYSEPSLNLDAENQDQFKDIDIMLFDKVIAFDNFRQKIIIIFNMKTDDLENNYKKACDELKGIADLIINGQKAEFQPLKLKSDFKPVFSREEYGEMVLKAKEYIRQGDIFQVVLSNRIEAEIEGSLFDTYRVLRTTNPSPYMFYFSSNDIEIAGASPETLVKVNNTKLYTFPLAGTRPRGKTVEEDLELEKELLADEKELAEHNMLVDLGRNDIGRIAEIGSVAVDKYMSVERFSHVMHIGSTVTGKLRKDLDSLSALDSILPAGTLSGAPKIRACEIINELEDNKRGIYGGAIGYVDLSGNLDTCISIRIAFARNNKVFVRSGAGIVADSVPDAEFDESMNKAAAVINALKTADGGLE